MSEKPKVSNFAFEMDANTGDLVLAYEWHVARRGWDRGRIVVTPETLARFQTERARIAERNPDIGPDVVTDTVLQHWAQSDIAARIDEGAA